MFSFLKSTPLPDDDFVTWLTAPFKWSLKHFDSALFYKHSILVIPSNKLFPGKMDSLEAMANLIFKKVKEYAFVQHWPCTLMDQNQCLTNEQPHIEIKGALRQLQGVEQKGIDAEHKLIFTYDPSQIGNPEAMIATFSHMFAHYLGNMVAEMPPGKGENWSEISEMIAIFMGFGIMFSNSAYVFRGGCGSCGQSTVARQASLTEEQATYALALFSVMKNIENKAVLPHLKSHLKSFYKRSVKDIKKRELEVALKP
jgi:hypothetical protein